jgi:beta-phosphoglucomutase-like phosphatase (HAD superfamily)
MLTETPGPPIQALIFNMDGLLVDSEPLTDIALQVFLDPLDCTPDWSNADLGARLMGRRMPEILAVRAELCGMTTPAHELNETLETLRLQTIRGRLLPYSGRQT